MTAINKRYWKWNTQNSVASIKLGDPIDTHLGSGLIHKSDQDNEYEGIEGVPWRITQKNGFINSICFREIFFDLIEPKIWECEINEFIKKVNPILEQTSNQMSGPILTIVFRGGFVAIAVIQIK